jgi:hypothetical protein
MQMSRDDNIGVEGNATYSLAFFLGPGFPLGFGRPSGVNTGPALLFTPFFFGPSVGGGIDDVGTGVPLATGVFELDSGGLSPFELGATGRVFEAVDEDSFEGDSSLTTGFSANLSRTLGDKFNVMINDVFDDFRRAAETVWGFVTEDIAIAVMLMMKVCEEGWRFSVAGFGKMASWASTPRNCRNREVSDGSSFDFRIVGR